MTTYTEDYIRDKLTKELDAKHVVSGEVVINDGGFLYL